MLRTETVKASSSTSYPKEMCLVNKDKETTASRLTSNKSFTADIEHSRATSKRSSK